MTDWATIKSKIRFGGDGNWCDQIKDTLFEPRGSLYAEERDEILRELKFFFDESETARSYFEWYFDPAPT